MTIALLSVSMNVYSSIRIAEEAQKLGHYIEQVDYTKCTVKVGGKPNIQFLNEDISKEFNAIIPRIGTPTTKHGVTVVKQFEANGAYSTASGVSIENARNKMQSLQLLSEKGIPVPESIFSIDPNTIEEQIMLLGGAPIIIKLQEGTQGLGVILAESIASAKSIIDTFYKLGTRILIQKFIAESKGEDIRVFIVGGKIVASMKRTSTADEFRSNVHRGGKTTLVKLTPKEKQMALEATKIIGLEVAGVDIIRSKKGPLVLEVNASPGLQGIEAISGVNIAKEIILLVEKNSIT